MHWFVCMRRLKMLRPGYRGGVWGWPGVADMRGNVGATPGLDSRFRGNDRRFGGDPNPKDTITQNAPCPQQPLLREVLGNS
jgi:hypothetical protein